MIVRFILIANKYRFDFFLLLSNGSLVLVIYLPADGHNSFSGFAIINEAAMNAINI